MKKTLIAINLSVLLAIQSANSTMPVIDSTNLAQAVQSFAQDAKSYATQLQQYAQMIKDTLNFEKTMKEYGVDISSITELLGEIQNVVDETTKIHDTIVNLPDDIFKTASNINNACSFLERSDSFSNKLKMAGKLKRNINRCLSTAKNSEDIMDDVIKMQNRAIDLMTTDKTEAYRLLREAEQLKQATEYLQKVDTSAKAEEIITIYDEYMESNSQLSRKKAFKEIGELADRIKSAKTQKEREMLQNTALVKITQQMQQMIDINTRTAAMLASEKTNKQRKQKHEEEYRIPMSIEELNSKIGEAMNKTPEYDKNGMPVITF